MVRKVNNVNYLTRVEAIDYLIFAYNLKWCMTRWINQKIAISFVDSSSQRNMIKVSAFFLKDTNNAYMTQQELDLEMLKIIR